MKKFKVKVTELRYHRYVYEVEAENEDEAANKYFEGVCVEETKDGKEESGGEEVDEVKEIK
jgi:hypothetical protein